MLVYDISSAASFNNVDKWLTELRTHADDTIPILLIGNKSDLSDERAVSTEEGQKFAQKERLLFLEGSAKTAENIEEAFTKLIAETLRSIRHEGLGAQPVAPPVISPGVTVAKEKRGCC
jgi:Ras-related protein Rab-11A